MAAFLDVYQATGSTLLASEDTGISRGTVSAWRNAKEPTDNERWFAQEYEGIKAAAASKRAIIHGENRGKPGWFGLV